MDTPNQLAFDEPDLASGLLALPDAGLDALPFGVVEMDHETRVLRYNLTESRFSGLSPEVVIGRRFFIEVAPCGDNRKVSHRYREETLDETLAYTFSLRMKPVPVTLRLLKPLGSTRMYMLVIWA
jgi:photoactive yellow protein